jgi:hypothetical protein
MTDRYLIEEFGRISGAQAAALPFSSPR